MQGGDSNHFTSYIQLNVQDGGDDDDDDFVECIYQILQSVFLRLSKVYLSDSLN